MSKKNRVISFAKAFGSAFVASLFNWMIGGLCALFGLGAALLAFVFGDLKAATCLIYEWLVPMFMGGALGSLFGVAIFEKLRKKP